MTDSPFNDDLDADYAEADYAEMEEEYWANLEEGADDEDEDEILEAFENDFDDDEDISF